MGKKLYVGNLPYAATEQVLVDTFSQCGTVESAHHAQHQPRPVCMPRAGYVVALAQRHLLARVRMQSTHW